MLVPVPVAVLPVLMMQLEYEQEITLVKQSLGELAQQQSHWQEYLQAWG